MPDGPGRDGDELDQRVGELPVVRGLFDETPVLLLGTEGPRHRIVAANAACRAAAHRSRIVGLEVADALPEVLRRHVLPMLDRAYVSGTSCTSPPWPVRIEDAGGTAHDVSLTVTVSPRRARDGAVIGVGLVALDAGGSGPARPSAEQQAVEAAEQRVARAREVVSAVQAELLPPGVPVLPRLQVAASHLLAEADTAAGGDWFDALPLPDGRVALAVGDVVGHGVPAAAVMGRLLVLLQDRLAENGDVAVALAAVDRATARLPGAGGATVCVAILDPRTGRLTYCTAGHPPPLLLPARGEARFLPATGSGPLGAGSTFTAGSARLAAGDQLLLYSDGLLERPGRTLAESTVELARVAADVAAGRVRREDRSLPVERVCALTPALMAGTGGYADDVTLLAVHRVSPPRDLGLCVPADARSLADVRRELGRWLAGFGAGEPDAFAVRHVVGELVANAVEHAYGSARGPRSSAGVVVTASLTPQGEVRAEVADTGRWREPSPTAGRGLGLYLGTELVDELVVDHGERGTTAHVRHRLSRPAQLLTAPAALPDVTSSPVPDVAELLIRAEPSSGGPRVRLDGPVDTATADRLHRELLQATAAGVRSLTVDLSGVTALGSVGVAVLHAAVTRGAAQGSELRLFAPAGSPAQQILALVALPHTTTDPDVPAA